MQLSRQVSVSPQRIENKHKSLFFGQLEDES
jgi:hypothetical protein